VHKVKVYDGDGCGDHANAPIERTEAHPIDQVGQEQARNHGLYQTRYQGMMAYGSVDTGQKEGIGI
jgi:hypothetical protein